MFISLLTINTSGATSPTDSYRNAILLGVGANLIFNYTNNSNLNWSAPVSGTYKIDALGAGSGGRGARVQGEIKLTAGDILNFKIHQHIMVVELEEQVKQQVVGRG